MAEILNIFNFLKEFNELSNPVITEIRNQKWSLNISDIPNIDDIQSVFLGHEMEDSEYLEICRPKLLPCPKPEAKLIEWIENDWTKLGVEEVKILDKIARESKNEEGELVYVEEHFHDDLARQDMYKLWIEERNRWRTIEVPKEKGLSLYNKIFQLYSEMKRESESVELILGDGNIKWNTSDRILDHPVLLQKVNVSFDAHIPSFRIYCEERKTELYTPMLRVIPTINQKMISEINTEVDKGDYDVAEIENTESLFKRIVNVIDINGNYVDESLPISSVASIHSAPTLFLRKRTLGYSSFIQSVIEDIQGDPEIELPGFFGTMTGAYNEEQQREIVEKSWNYSGIDKDVLLTLPANTEQLRIIKYLEKYGAVLVQGPPGTGKTHTIANLIGHLLSQGNSVLVTSQTEKALAVLKEKVYKDPKDPEMNLQSLCINLSSSASQKKEMDSSINEIASKSSTLDLYSSQVKIRQLEEDRVQLVEESKQLMQELVRVRSLEYKDLIYDNHSISPIEAAKFLRKGVGIYDYIEGKSNNDEVGFPLTHDELVFLYSSNNHLSSEEEELLKTDYPENDEIIGSMEFNEIIGHINDLKSDIEKNELIEDVEFLVDIDLVRQLLEESNKLISKIMSFTSMEKSIVSMSMSDPTYPNLWSDVIQRTEEIQPKYESYRKLKLNDDFSIDDVSINKESLLILREIIDTGKEKPVGLFSKGNWKKLRATIKINDKSVETREDFVKVHEIISYEIEKKEIINQLVKLLKDVVEPEKLEFDDFENKIRKYREHIVSALNWFKSDFEEYYKRVEDSIHWKMENKLTRTSMMSDVETATRELHTLNQLLQTQVDLVKLGELQNRIGDYMMLLGNYADQNHLINALSESVSSHNVSSYSDHLKKLNLLIGKRDIASKREMLLSKIKSVAPVLALEIEQRKGVHLDSSIPEYFDDAWKHFQIRNQIERLDNVDPEKIQMDIEQHNGALLKNARTLAYEKAWYEKIHNQTDKQNQALQGWRNTIKQIGKGTGKKAPMLKAKARELMPLCQTAIPVWIMPLNRVVESFNPSNNKFDVLIIDEASQANILALAALYLAKKVIIVGDDEQVSPDTVGVKTDEVNALIAQHLERIPNNHLFNGVTSLYDMAKSSGFRPLMLTEHFRCLPEIIEFSNRLSYNGKIKPLRDSSNVSIYPSVIEYRVPGAIRDSKKVNETEAEHIVSLIQAFIEVDEYSKQTIGVISMLGSEQSSVIEKKLQAVIDPVEYEDRRIQCGTPPQFQGDERDIIILSLVDSPNENGGPLRLLSEDGHNDKYRKRYNVAVSRAKNQLWVVHSLNPEIDLKPDDLRLKLIKYAMKPNLENDSLLAMSESPFEMEVMKYLLDRNYKVIPQFKVGAYRIDMVIQYEDRKVALECDGEKSHNINNLDNDLARQAILERLGWRFIRIRGSVYYRDSEQTMKEVVESLSKHGIHPSYKEDDTVVRRNDSLVNLVKIKARDFRSIEHNGDLSEEDDVVIEELHADGLSSQVATSIQEANGQLSDEDDSLVIIEAVVEETEPLEIVDAAFLEKESESVDRFLSEHDKVEDFENQADRNREVEKVNKDESKYKFDFRKDSHNKTVLKKESKKSVSSMAGQTKNVVSEMTQLMKPKFDFRK